MDEIERLRERCEAYKGQVEAGGTAIGYLRQTIRDIAAEANHGINSPAEALSRVASICAPFATVEPSLQREKP